MSLSAIQNPAALPLLRQKAQEHAAALPPLLAEAQHLAAAMLIGSHGRRRAGPGEEFWQFRDAMPGDPWRHIDWRRSARSDQTYIRQLEWQAAQSVLLWLDQAHSMQFSGAKNRPTKAARGLVLGLACAILLLRGGERVGLMSDVEPPRAGNRQLDRLCAQLGTQGAVEEYGLPGKRLFPKGSRAVFISDFLGDWQAVRATLARAADQGVRGILIQILDPIEESFPFDGRTVFESMGGALRFETLRAKGLRQAYQAKLAARKADLQDIAAMAGWGYLCHHTDDAAQSALMWAYTALQESR